MMRSIIKNELSLATLCPELARQWDHERNAPLTPDNVTPTSNYKVWWMNADGKRWRARIIDRYNKRGCPFSVGRVQYVGRFI